MELIGKKFSFSGGYIEFTGENPNKVNTTWGSGAFIRIRENIFDVYWNNHHHILTFNSEFTWYYSIRSKPNDYMYTNGSCILLPPPSSPWISCQLAGGIGNRLFQITSALGLAERLKRRVVFYTPVNTDLKHQSKENIYSLFPYISCVTEGCESVDVHEAAGGEYSYTMDVPHTEKNILLFGYRQHPKYFPSYSILPSFSMFPIEEREHILSKYCISSHEEKRKTWFIHIRLGDFLLYNDLTHVNVKSYHAHLVHTLPTDANIIVVSNEPNRAQVLLQECTNRKFTLCTEIDERITLYIMSQCWGGAIVANSTFSWWGSYFAYHTTPYKSSYKAYYPEEWVRGKEGIPITPWGFKSKIQ